MTDVRKAKVQLQLSEAERKLQAIAVLYDASVAYFSWKKTTVKYSYTKLIIKMPKFVLTELNL
jgi:hypothetical protein